MRIKNFGFDFYIARRQTLSEQDLDLSPPTGTRPAVNKPTGGKMLWGSSNRDEYEFDGDTYWLEWTKIDWDSLYSQYKYIYKITVDMSGVFSIRDYEQDYVNTDPRFLEFDTRPYGKYHLNFPMIAKYYGGFYLSEAAASEGHLADSIYADGKRMDDFNAYDTEQVIVWDTSIMTVTGVYQFDPETRQVTEMKSLGLTNNALKYMGLL
jgi:hypothetical protein